MDSSDEEDSQRLREALDPEFMNDSLFSFQQYVAKHLSLILDQDLEKRLVSVKTITHKKKTKNRVKLFRNSEKCLKLHKEETTKKPKLKHNFDYSKFTEAAIDPSDIVNEVKNWSTTTKGKVFHYRIDTNGTLSLI
ncbi:hypothetical protein RN001_010392 [Aquatica leii]|uniref:Protein CUSTOS n=1 Tax=Aquatica leii TaxID=1421715 RepID=A0AAN7P9I1_9COLE|nr:hypothetical protein RN001_010392 [Aquatica leii]